jgi:hypothetical protein
MLFVPSACTTSAGGGGGGGSNRARRALRPAAPCRPLFHLLQGEGGPRVHRPRAIIWVHVGGTDPRGNSNDRTTEWSIRTKYSYGDTNTANSGNILFYSGITPSLFLSYSSSFLFFHAQEGKRVA